MATLLLAEHDNASLKDPDAEGADRRRRPRRTVTVLVAGTGCGPAAEAASKLAGVAKVLVADNAAYANLLAEPTAALIVSIAAAMTRSSRPPPRTARTSCRASQPCST